MLSFLSSILFAATTVTAVPYSGVVEGYYGRPWGTDGRISLMEFMGERGLNTYVYGPKDDPYHHAKWREAYPEKEAADFRKLLAVAKKNKIHFYWAIHLGNFNGEYEALFKKLESMYDLGVRAFGVFFDDFGAANAQLHSEIGNRIINEFLKKKGDCANLLVCPNVYWGSGHPYQKELGAKLDKSAMIMWTGHWICSDIKAQDVEKITADFQRPPFIWWNWPVNDYCRRKVLLGRLYGLDNCTYAGVVLNPMENCEANKISVFSLGEWVKNPSAFDSKQVWEESFGKLYSDAEIAQAMRVFAEHNSDQSNNGHGYRREESVSAESLCAKAREEFRANGKLSPETEKAVLELFKEVGRASKMLDKKLPKKYPQLHWEIEGWLKAEINQMGIGVLAVNFVQNPRALTNKELLLKLKALRDAEKRDAAAHVEKFRGATFDNDKRNIKPPVASDRVLLPLVKELLETTLNREYVRRAGRSFAEDFGLTALTGAKAFPKLVTYTEETGFGIERVLEQKRLESDEWFGLTVPKSVEVRELDVRLGNEVAQQSSTLEASVDGTTWTELKDIKREGGRLRTNLDPKRGWTSFRVRNTSRHAVDVKLNLFRVGTVGETELLDALIRALLSK